MVNPPAPRKLKQILLSVCLPIVVGRNPQVALVTGMWFLLLMSAASSLLMLLHFFGGRAENRAASQQTHQAAWQEKERALALPTAGDLAISGPSALHDAVYPAIVLGVRSPPALPARLCTLPLGALEKQDAPRYLPLPSPVLGHYLEAGGGASARLPGAAGGGLSGVGACSVWPALRALSSSAPIVWCRLWLWCRA